MADGLGRLLQRLLELVLELLRLLLGVGGELAALGTDRLEAGLDLGVGVESSDVLGRDVVGLEVLVHVPGGNGACHAVPVL